MKIILQICLDMEVMVRLWSAYSQVMVRVSWQVKEKKRRRERLR